MCKCASAASQLAEAHIVIQKTNEWTTQQESEARFILDVSVSGTKVAALVRKDLRNERKDERKT